MNMGPTIACGCVASKFLCKNIFIDIIADEGSEKQYINLQDIS